MTFARKSHWIKYGNWGLTIPLPQLLTDEAETNRKFVTRNPNIEKISDTLSTLKVVNKTISVSAKMCAESVLFKIHRQLLPTKTKAI